jgi:mannitol-1-/sugar-/sorbitol-6-phosphatase
MDLTCAALLCDLDGTLVDSSAVVERSWRVWAGEYGVDPEHVIALSSGRRSADAIDELLPAADRAGALARIDALELTDVDGVVPAPGALDLLAGLRGTPWAVVTSGSAALMTVRMDAAGIPRPPVLVTADDVSAGKPDPEGYRLAARRLGLDPADCVVLEDAPAGVAAGKAAGATVLAVTTTHDAAALGGADALVAGLSALDLGVNGSRIRLRVRPDRKEPGRRRQGAAP